MKISDLIHRSHQTAKDKGWWDEGVANRNIGEQFLLFTTEVTEAFEEWRKGHKLDEIYYHDAFKDHDWDQESLEAVHDRPIDKILKSDPSIYKPEGVCVELADLFIRVADTVGAYGLEDVFERALREKLDYNDTREHRHGGKLA